MAETETVPTAPPKEDVNTGVVATDKLPSPEVISKISEYTVQDHTGKAHLFESLYDGPESPSRTLVIFIRHFFCGNCQEFIFALSQSLKPSDLQNLPTSTSLIIIGCGDPGLIDFYAKETQCPFPIYADPGRRLYKALGLVQSYGLGSRPEYFRKSMFQMTMEGITQALKKFGSGLMMKGGDSSQNGGEFIFEAGSGSEVGGDGKTITWCHRMTNTRDHLGFEELKQVLDPGRQVLKD